MSQVLTLDLGNSNPHYCLYSNGEASEAKPIDQIKDDSFSESLKVIISNVGKQIPSFVSQYQIIELPTISSQKFLDMPVNYTASLGEDRLVQAYYLYRKLIENKCINLIDAGTFITVDKISKEKGFEGGLIFPGIMAFLESYQKGARLPKLDIEQILWGTNINTCANNTYEAISEATKLYIENILKPFTHESIILTGGSSHLVSSYLPEQRTQQLPKLIHDSLYFLSEQLTN